MARYNGYGVGTGSQLIGYTVNGDAVDWTYGDQNIIAYTPEVGTPTQGFWPSENEIIQLCDDQFHPNKVFAFVAGPDIIIDSYEITEDFILQGEELEIELTIKNRGLINSDSDIEISYTPLNNWTVINSEPFIISDLDAQDSDNLLLNIMIDSETPQGIVSGVILQIDCDNSFLRQDTIQYSIGQPEMIFYEGFENGVERWNLDNNWALTEEAQFGQSALTDSPEGQYNADSETIAELDIIFNLSYLMNPIIQFKAKWDIESNYDFVRFQGYSEAAGWVSLSGAYTENGVGQPAQPLGEPGYDGLQESWVEETIPLNQNNQISFEKFRFIQTSDSFVEGEGFLVDDFSISGYPLGLIGDYNLDMNVDIYDLLMLSDFLLFGDIPTDTQLFFCDLDRSGSLDIMDLILLTNKILSF